MKRHTNSKSVVKANRFLVLRPSLLVPRAFTLVELLVVISIIGILMALTIPAVFHVITAGKDAAIYAELKQLEAACQAYKEKFGEYPPDFAGVNLASPGCDAPRAAVLRHLSKAFPRYTPSDWNEFRDDVLNGWGIDINANLRTPFNALTFWLGGRPYNGRFTGFSANQLDPFDGSTSRIGPFFEFDVNRVNANGCYWPRVATGNLTSGAIAYFRAENGGYFNKSVVDLGDASNPTVFPAVDSNQSDPTTDPPRYAWINPQSFQIFSAGLDYHYSEPVEHPEFYPNNAVIPTAPLGPYEYPNGGNYDPVAGYTYDDITNFSEGRLENAMP